MGESRGHGYKGETRLFIFQNLHRWFMYLAVIFLFILSYDVYLSCRWPDGFGVSVGTLVLTASTVSLSLYTLSCHSLRHVIGGRLNRFSQTGGQKLCHKAWQCASILNKRHMLYAWVSLFLVSGADLYVYLVASGRIENIRLF